MKIPKGRFLPGFLVAVAGCFPTLVGPEYSDQSDTKTSDQTQGKGLGLWRCEVGWVPLAKKEDYPADTGQRTEFDHCQQVLKVGTPADSHIIDGHQKEHKGRGDDFL